MLPEHKTWSVFVLASMVLAYKPGQDEAVAGNLISICLDELGDPDPVLRQWLAICLGRPWDRQEEARWRGGRDNAQEWLYSLLGDQVPEVTAAAVYALDTFLNACRELAGQVIQECHDPLIIQPVSLDVTTVRKKQEEELGIVIEGGFVYHHVNEVRMLNPAARIEKGDEIVQAVLHFPYALTNGPFFNLSLRCVLQVMGKNPVELILTLKKHSTFGQIYIKHFRIPSCSSCRPVVPSGDLPSCTEEGSGCKGGSGIGITFCRLHHYNYPLRISLLDIV